MRRNLVSVIVLFILLAFSACTTIPDGAKETETKENPQNTVAMNAQYPYYETAEEIVDKADLVFSGTVENSSCIFDNDMAYLNLDQSIYYMDEAGGGAEESGNITLSQILENLE